MISYLEESSVNMISVEFLFYNNFYILR